MQRIAVLITVHNRKDKTSKCLKHLFEQKGLSDDYRIEVFLTDDGSSDGTSELIRSMYPEVNILKGDGTLFWNRGMHLAWTEAAKNSPDYYLWLNDDTYLFSDGIIRLLDSSSGNSVTVGSTCDSATQRNITYGGRDKKSSFVFDENRCLQCVYMNGNIVLIPNSVFQKIGFNDPFFRHSTGDTDYGLSAREKGCDLVVAPGFIGICDLHKSVDDWSNPSISLISRWKHLLSPLGANPFEFFYFRKKHFGVFPACITFCSNILHVCFPRLWNTHNL